MKTLESSDINAMVPFSIQSRAIGLAMSASTLTWGTSPVWHGTTRNCNAIWGTQGRWTPPPSVRKPMPAVLFVN
jgi:hypothetical protein